MEKNLFEIATRKRIRFPYNGVISVEDLWQLPVTKLDGIYKTLNAELKQSSEESLLETKSAKDEELEIKVEIIKYIVKFKQDAAKALETAKVKKEQKAKILEVIEKKQGEALENKSIEELQKLADEM